MVKSKKNSRVILVEEPTRFDLVRTIRDNRWYAVACVCALLLAAIVISPMLKSGFFGDDALQSTTFARSALNVEGSSLFKATWNLQKVAAQSGRFFPFSTYTLIPFYLVDGNVHQFKVYVFVLVLLNLVLFAFFAWQLTRSKALALFALLLPPLVFQFRSASFHDPILGFSGHLQIVALLTLGSLIALVAFLDTRRRSFLVTSLVLYACTLLTYEIAIPFVLLYFTIIWLYPSRSGFWISVRRSWPFAALPALTIAISVGLRIYYGAALAGVAGAQGAGAGMGAYTINLDVAPAITMFFRQVVASMPLSYQTFAGTAGARGLFPGPGYAFAVRPFLGILVMAGFAVLSAFVIYLAWREPTVERGSHRTALLALVLGIELLVLPNVLISLSPVYQSAVYLGVAYLPVYLSYFGVALILIAALQALRARVAGQPASRAIGIVVAVVVAAACVGVGLMNFGNNTIDVEAWNRRAWYPREVLTEAIGAGLFSAVPQGATVVVANPNAWDNASFYAAEAGKSFTVKPVDATSVATFVAGRTSTVATDGATVYRFSADENTYLLTYRGFWSGNGFAVLGRIDEVAVSATGEPVVKLEPVSLYIAAKPLPGSQATIPGAALQSPVTQVSPAVLGIDPSTLTAVGSGASWGLFKTAPGVIIPVGL